MGQMVSKNSVVIALVLLFSMVFGQELTQEYYKGKILLNNGLLVEGKKLVIGNDAANMVVNNSKVTYKLTDIKQIQAKKGKGKKCGNTCAGSCLGLALGSYLASGGEIEDSYGNTEKVDFGQYMLGTAIWVGLFYGTGYFIGALTDSWEVIYVGEGTSSGPIEPLSTTVGADDWGNDS